MTKQVFVRGCKVYYGTLQGIIVDVERNAQKVSVLMESGRFRKNLSIKALYINPRWTVTSQVASQAEIDSMISAYESLTDTIYSAKVEVVSNTGMVCHSFKTLSVPSTTSVESYVATAYKSYANVADAKVLEYVVSDDQLTMPVN